MKENVLQINGKITVNFDVSVKNIVYVKKFKVYIWNPATCSGKNGNTFQIL